MRLIRLAFIAFSVLTVAACGRGGGEPAEQKTAAAEPVALVSRDVLFGNPERFRGRISPDGRYVSFTAPVDGVQNVWVAPADNINAANPVTNDTDRGIRVYDWAHDGKHLIYRQDKGGDENWQLYAVDVTTGESRTLTPYEGAQANVAMLTPERPDTALVAINDRDASYHDLYEIDIATGERELAQQNNGFLNFVTDYEYNVRLAVRPTEDGGYDYLKPDGQGGWARFISISQADSLSTNPVGITPDGEGLYLLDSRDRDTAALYHVNLQSGERELIFEDPRADVSGVLQHPVTHAVQAVQVNHTKIEWTVLDKAIAQDLQVLSELASEVDVLARSDDDRYWIVTGEEADAPLKYYWYDRQGQQAELLFNTQPALSEQPLVPMHPVVITARDGLKLVSYLSLPAHADPDGDGKPEAEPLPMVLFVHGGPWARDDWGYDAYHQWLANRGYAVLSVNYRGSTGFGKSFVNAGDREWAGKMHDDLITAVNWAVEQGIADPDQVAIMGGSYGGYATLVGLTFTPDTFACGVDIVGPSNLETLLNSIPPYWKAFFEQFAVRVGDPRTAEGRKLLQARSPLTYVDRISKPLLIGQGANDPRVKQAESDQIVEAMEAKGIPVTYVLYPDEGHGFARPENRKSFNAIAEAFLGECLGGRIEPIGDDFQGSSLQVPAGREHVPGLSEALKSE